MSDTDPTTAAEDVCLTLYNGHRPDLALTPGTRRLLARARPGRFMVHSSPRALMGVDPTAPGCAGAAGVLAELRRLRPDATLEAGIGCDGWTEAAARGESDTAVAWLVDSASYMVRAGCSGIVWDLESAGEKFPTVAAAMAPRVLEGLDKRHPGTRQAFTSYPIVTQHKRLPYRAWHAPPVDRTIVQLYDDVPGGASPGALRALVAWSAKDRAEAVRLGMIPAECEWAWYFQLHGQVTDELVAVCTGPGAARSLSFWAAPSRIDAAGEDALVRICDARRAKV